MKLLQYIKNLFNRKKPSTTELGQYAYSNVYRYDIWIYPRTLSSQVECVLDTISHISFGVSQDQLILFHSLSKVKLQTLNVYIPLEDWTMLRCVFDQDQLSILVNFNLIGEIDLTHIFQPSSIEIINVLPFHGLVCDIALTSFIPSTFSLDQEQS